MPANEIFDSGAGAGYSKPALQRAARRLKIKHKKAGMAGGWIWALPEDAEGCEDFNIPGAEPSGEDFTPA